MIFYLELLGVGPVKKNTLYNVIDLTDTWDLLMGNPQVVKMDLEREIKENLLR